MSLSLDEKSGALQAFAALDILVLVMLLGFVANSLVHRAGLEVEMPQTAAKFQVPNERIILTVKGAAEPVYYLDSKPLAKGELVTALRRKRDEEGVRMVVVEADRRLPSMWLLRISGVIQAEGLDCGWLGEPTLPTVLP